LLVLERGILGLGFRRKSKNAKKRKKPSPNERDHTGNWASEEENTITYGTRA